MSCYYAVQVATGQEQKIKERYVRYYCSYALFASTEVLIPCQLIRRKNKHNYKNIWAPIWPGYLLIKCPEMTEQLYYMLKRLSGVIRVLQNPIPVWELNEIVNKNPN